MSSLMLGMVMLSALDLEPLITLQQLSQEQGSSGTGRFHGVAIQVGQQLSEVQNAIENLKFCFVLHFVLSRSDLFYFIRSFIRYIYF